MMMDPSAHPQQMKVVQHLVYVGSGCGDYPMLVKCLNLCILVSCAAKQGPGISASRTNLRNKCFGSGMMMDPSAHPQQMKVMQHLICVEVDLGTIPCCTCPSRHCPFPPKLLGIER